MKKIILNIITSIDQRIAEPDGSIEWLSNFPMSEEMRRDYRKFMSSIGTIIMGGRCWRELSNMDALGAYADKSIYVVTRNDCGAKENVDFITQDILQSIASLREIGTEGDICLIGGGEITSLLLDAGLVDEMRLIYAPVLLGKGVLLFPERHKESEWELIGNKSYDCGVLMIEYRKK